jgi:hypothetical protein
MDRFTKYFAGVFHKIRSSHRSTRRATASTQSRLSLESLDERYMPSVSPLTLASNSELTNDSVRVSHETEFSKMDMAIALDSTTERKH